MPEENTTEEGNLNEKLESLKLLLSHPAFRKKIFQHLGLDTTRSNKGAYYNPHYAKELMPEINRMIEDEKKRDILFPLEFYGPGMSLNTLRNQIFQAVSYILDHLDTDDKRFHTWRQQVEIKTIEGQGVRVAWLRDSSPKNAGRTFFSQPVVEETKSNEWKDALYQWMENSESPFIHIKELSLTQEDQKNVIELFQGATHSNGKPMYKVHVNATAILVERIKEE